MVDHGRRVATRRGPHRWRVVTLAAIALLALVAAAATSAAAGATAAAPVGAPAGARDARPPAAPEAVAGWYTADQAGRGRGAYQEHCARCHSPDLRARSAYISLYDYPALKGAYFWDRWEGQTVHALLLVIEHTMPLDAPFSLDGRTYADVAAFILEQNGFVPGSAELPATADDPRRLVGMQLERSVARPLARAQDVGPGRGVPRPDDSPPPPVAAGREGGEARSDADRLFLQAQVDRAQTVYAARCARCHGSGLQGIGVAPSLAGDNFMERWAGEPVSDLYWVVNELMPIDDPASLLPQTAADLVAFILARNGFEAGTRALPPDESALADDVIERGGTP